MLNIHVIIRHLSLMLLFASVGIPAAASEADIQWTPQITKGGFIISAPAIDNDALIKEIASLKIALMHEKKLLSRQAEQKRFKDKDTLLSAFLPGGLIYAAYKKNLHARAVKDYERTSSLLKVINTDLAALITIDSPVLVAQASNKTSF